jgi:F-type H+-transporting ATPase subunit c
MSITSRQFAGGTMRNAWALAIQQNKETNIMTLELISMAADAAAVAPSGIAGNITQAVGGAGAAIGVGLIGSKAVEAVGRNPGAFGNILTLGIIAMALAEGLGILAFFVSK